MPSADTGTAPHWPATYRVAGSEAAAERLTDFAFPWRDEPCPATSFRAWQCSSALHGTLHFEFEALDRDIVLDQSADADQAVLDSDRVELFFATSADLSTPYYGFEIDPRGRVYDYSARYHRQFDPTWTFDGLTITTAEINDEWYRICGLFSLPTLAGLGCIQPDNSLIVGVYRAEFSHLPDGTLQRDWISWLDPQTPTPDFHVPASFGRFQLQPNTP